MAHSSPTRASSPHLLLLGISAVGVAAFLYPFLLSAGQDAGVGNVAHTREAPFLFAILSGACLLAALLTTADGQAGTAHSKQVALLGVLVAIDATLRLVPGVLGASPIFPLIILVGATFGATFGFQMGAMTMLLSAFLTGGVGPWLPFQMFAAGWIGLTAGWLPAMRTPRQRLLVLAAFGALWGLLFGAIMNLWFWPLTAPGAGDTASLYWHPGLGLTETLTRYARFYLTTSLVFDVLRGAANAALLLFLGGPVLRLLERYRQRFAWEPWTPS